MAGANTTSPTSDQLFQQWHGQLVPWSYQPGFAVLSYVVSFIGAVTTLELIQRRTAQMGRLNNVLLVGAAISMGGVAIWSMHYVGNRAIVMAGGEPQLQIAYSGGFTTLSLFVPIIVLLVAFVATGTKDRVPWWRIAVGGTLAGLAICGMHYLGNASISNYVCEYEQANIVASGIIAIAASSVALAFFFVFRAGWTSAWWKRTISEVILAGAVSGMHWCASGGTRYRLAALKPNTASELSRNTTVIIVICLALGASFLMGGLAVYLAYVTKRFANRARKVQLAAAVFDRQGRVMVSPDGFLPCEKITDSFVETSPQDAFGTAHPLFHWMFKVSRNWSCVSPLLEDMSSHLAKLSGGPKRGLRLSNNHHEPVENYDTTVRQLFCTAAGTLAASLKLNLEQVGILWDDVLVTGGLEASKNTGFRWSSSHERDAEDIFGRVTADGHDSGSTSDPGLAEKGSRFWVETGNDGRGSLLFLVRKAETSGDEEALEAAGYRFAELHQVSSLISTRMRIRTPDLEGKLRDMAANAQQKAMLEPGLHLGLFGVRAQLGVFAFDVLARKGARNLLPSVPMELDRLEKWHIDYVEQLDRMSINAMLHVLESGGRGKGAEAGKDTETAVFARKLSDTLTALRTWLDDSTLADAMVTSKVVQVPCSGSPNGGVGQTATMTALRAVIPVSHGLAENSRCELVPLGLFRAHQMAYTGSPHHAAFAERAARELNPSTPDGVADGESKTAGSTRTTETAVAEGQAENPAEEVTGRWSRWQVASRTALGNRRTSRPRSAGAAAVGGDGSPLPTTSEGSPRESKQSMGSSMLKLWKGEDGGGPMGLQGGRSATVGGSGLTVPEGHGSEHAKLSAGRRLSALEILVRKAGGHSRLGPADERDSEAEGSMEMRRLPGTKGGLEARPPSKDGSELPNFVDELFTVGRY
ncbi:hypothetical protein RB599_004167 [Gaeumannomyces hyphopodioides]